MHKLIALIVLVLSATVGNSQELVKAKDGSGVYGYKNTPKQPWSEWLVHDPDRPVPKRVDAGKVSSSAPAPSDATILFDGRDASGWKALGDWKIEDGCLVAGNVQLTTKETFGDIQLHVEFMGPVGFDGPWYNRGNNGISLMGLYEVQIFDSYNEKIYGDGQCAAIYGQTPPLVNATRPPGEWQTFDIIFVAPKFDGEKLTAAPRVTVLHNGLIAHINQEIFGEAAHCALPAFKQKVPTGPIVLGGHGCPVRFRNIWVRRLEIR